MYYRYTTTHHNPHIDSTAMLSDTVCSENNLYVWVHAVIEVVLTEQGKENVGQWTRAGSLEIYSRPFAAEPWLLWLNC